MCNKAWCAGIINNSVQIMNGLFVLQFLIIVTIIHIVFVSGNE